MSRNLEEELKSLTPSQRNAVEWDLGSLLVLAGPGAGKTRVLTTRIARILYETPDELFRVLALTFTNRAADEMRRRLEDKFDLPSDRVFIGTFHSFCAQQLRLHGSHVGIEPDYGVYASLSDREGLLRDALRQAAKHGTAVSERDVELLRMIDNHRLSLNDPPSGIDQTLDGHPNHRFALVYDIYERALKENNVLDFESMIYKTWQLARRRPTFCERIRRAYRYWLIDEFQDLSRAQYKILRELAGKSFTNLFAVADEDQLIYSWRGASREGLREFQSEFAAERVYFQENHRCPPDVVKAANRLIAHNSLRDRSKPRVISVKMGSEFPIRVRSYSDDIQEAVAVSKYFEALDPVDRSQGGVLARNRAALNLLLNAFRNRRVPAVVMKGSREFSSSQFRWLESCLNLAVRPLDRQRMRHLAVDSGRLVDALRVDPDRIIAEGGISLESYLEVWARFAAAVRDPLAERLVGTARSLLESRRDWRQIMEKAVAYLCESEETGGGSVGDAEEDYKVWAEDSQHIFAEHGALTELPTFLQALAIRSRNQRVDEGTVRLATIHSAKGLEFDKVWVVGLAETIIPSYHAISSANQEDIEEERRNLFVAITRTKSELTLSYPNVQEGWPKDPSRFLTEMFGSPAPSS